MSSPHSKQRRARDEFAVAALTAADAARPGLHYGPGAFPASGIESNPITLQPSGNGTVGAPMTCL